MLGTYYSRCKYSYTIRQNLGARVAAPATKLFYLRGITKNTQQGAHFLKRDSCVSSIILIDHSSSSPSSFCLAAAEEPRLPAPAAEEERRVGGAGKLSPGDCRELSWVAPPASSHIQAKDSSRTFIKPAKAVTVAAGSRGGGHNEIVNCVMYAYISHSSHVTLVQRRK